MKSLLKILYFLLALLILVLIAGLFLPRDGHIESSISIKASPDIVFDQVNTLRNWDKWSPWFDADTSMRVSFDGPVSGDGASYKWVSTHSGTGRLTVTASEPLKRVEALIDFGIRGKATTTWAFDSNEGKGTKLTWAFDNKDMGYFERYFMVLFKKNMLTTFNNGLQKIKTLSEKLRLDRISEIRVIDTQIQPSLGIIDSSASEQMGAKMADLYNKLSVYLLKRNLLPTGPPYTIYYNWNPKGITKFACCMPITKKTWGWKEYSYIELPQGRAATVTHWGNYGTATPYLALDKYLKENNLKMGDLIWETYINAPSSEPDTSMWEMQIYYPVQ